MTPLERLIYLDIALRYDGVALGEDGWDWDAERNFGNELTLLPSKVFNRLRKERRELIKKLVDEV